MEYTQKYPNVELTITGGTIQEIGTQMWSGGLDLALVVLPFNSAALEKIIVFEESFVGVLASSHSLARKTHLKISDLSAERFILPRRGQNTRKLIDRFLFNEKITPRVAIELAEAEAIKAMVARGLGVSLLPESAFSPDTKSLGIKTFPIPREQLRRTLAIVYPKPRALRPAAMALIELLQKHFHAKHRVR
jgi:LysR family transcriptional activator of glutamate synthase operon